MSEARQKKHVLWVTTCVLGLGLLAGGCLSPLRDGTSYPRAGRALCLRGFIDIFSLGLDDLAGRLRRSGVNSRSIGDWTWRALPSQILKAHREGSLDRPLVLVGHSYGADNSLRIARTLKPHGVDIDLIILLDATAPPRVPPNVRHCIHYYRRTIVGDLFPLLSAGNPVLPEYGNTRTKIDNIVINRETFGKAADWIDHWNIDRSRAIHDRVTQEVLRVCPPRYARDHRSPAGSDSQVGRKANGE